MLEGGAGLACVQPKRETQMTQLKQLLLAPISLKFGGADFQKWKVNLTSLNLHRFHLKSHFVCRDLHVSKLSLGSINVCYDSNSPVRIC